MAGRETGHVVHGEHRIAGEALKQAVFDHHSGAAAAFFRWLKDQVQGAAEVRLPRQIARRRQQHGGVPVVAAGVHHPGMGAGVRQAGCFGNRQGVHIGADAERFSRPMLQCGDNTGLSYAARDAVTPFRQPLRHQIRGGELLESQLRVGVKVAAKGDHLIMNGGDIRQYQ